MNVVQSKRKRTTNNAVNRDYLDFLRCNPIGTERHANDPSPGNRQYTISTHATRGNTLVKQSSTYFSITSGRGYAHCEVGIAYIDIESPSVKLIQLSDDPWYSGLIMKIHIVDPCEILVPDTIYDAKSETSEGKLMKFIREEFPKLSITKLPRRHFNEALGMELIKKYGSDKYNYVKEEVTAKYYALAAATALLKYLQFVHSIFFKENSLKLDFETKFAHMQIGIDTSYQLELLPQNNPNTVKSKFPSLYSVLDHCVTSFGKRTLRARILEPMCDIPSITAIHDCIAELNQQESVEFGPMLRQVLRNFNNVERLHKLALIVPQDDNIRAAEMLINQVLHLKKCLQFVPLLRMKLAPLFCQKFQEIQVNLMDDRYTSILNHIDHFINPNQMEFHSDSSSKLAQHIHCVQDGVNDLIDVLRKSYHDLIAQIEALVGGLCIKHGHTYKTNYSVKRGFHMTLTIPNRAVTFDFPAEVEVLEFRRNTCVLTTSEVNRLNIRVQSVIEEIIIQSNVVIASMLNDVVKEIDAIYDLSAFTATLDIILSFATVSANEMFVRPVFGDEMRVVDAIHPLLEQNIHRTLPTPNNIIATPEYNFFMITGPNMSGKTVYLKTIAVLQVMAQLGCFVPAKSAQFRITDRLFSRMGFNDSIEKNLSTFMMEMNNMEHILKTVTPNSMVIIDELCRSTNPKEGAQLAWNLCKHLAAIHGIFNDGRYFINDEHDVNQITQCSNEVSSTTTRNAPNTPVTVPTTTATHNSSWKNTKLNMITSPFIFLTTHFHSLTKLSESCVNVVNLSFSAEEVTNNENERSLTYNHRIQEGVTTTKSYGLAVAKTVRFPSDIMNEAFELSAEFMSGLSIQNTNGQKRMLSNVGRQILQIGDVNDVTSVISSMINFPLGDSQSHQRNDRRRRLRRFTEQNADNQIVGGSSGGETNVTSSSTYEDHFKMDRILYNIFGDMMSITRTTQIEFETYSDGDENERCDAQNDAIENFLATFISDQSDELIEALTNLNLSLEMSTPSVEQMPIQNQQNTIANDKDQHQRMNNLQLSHDAMEHDGGGGGGNYSKKSSIISIQDVASIVRQSPHDDEIISETPSPQRLQLDASDVRSRSRNGSSNESIVLPGNRRRTPVFAPRQSTPSPRQSSIHKTPRFDQMPSFVGHINSPSPHSGRVTSNDIDSSGSFFSRPTQMNVFTDPNEHIGMDDSQDSIGPSRNTFSGFNHFSQGFQSFKNDFQDTSFHFDPEFSSKFFSTEQQNDAADNSIDDDGNVDMDDFDFPSNSFERASFSSDILSQRLERKRPNLQNIRKHANSSQFFTYSEPSSPHSKASGSSSSFRSSDSVRSDSSVMSKNQSNPNRKIPMIHPSKLKNTVFGDTMKMFKTPNAANTNQKATGILQQQHQRQQQVPQRMPTHANTVISNQIEARATDTNRTVALQRLQRIQETRAMAAAVDANVIPQERMTTNLSNPNVYSPNEETTESNGNDESVDAIILPPSAFR